MKKAALLLLSLFAICTLLTTQSLAASGQPAAPAEEGGIQRSVGERTTPGQTPAGETTMMQQDKRASEFMGKSVKTREGEDFGKVEDIVVFGEGSVHYVVLAREGSDQLIPVPWVALKSGDQEDTLIIDMDRERLAAAPNFSRDQWPDLAGPEWAEKVHSYYGGAKTEGTMKKSY